jgi:outer membrane protein OmpA-like peptidoglycan-associated protein
MVMTLGDVLFATGKADLQPGAMNTVDRLAVFLSQYPDKTVLIEGFTDNTGTDAFNQGLSERRAASVESALIQAGVSPGRISTIGYGKARPIADNGTAEGRLRNRRVEIVING